MTPWPAFAALWDALTGRQSAVALDADAADLVRRLGLPAQTLADIVQTDSLHPHFHYRHFTRAKKGGGRREITEPDEKLKRVQQAILARYLAAEAPHPAAVAYQKGKSTAHHVWAHAGAEIIVTADVQDFFPNTREDRVEDWWRERLAGDLARLLARLTTHQGGLPQGAPTSPALSNLVNREMDGRLAHRAESAGARYTRYCDDLAFSWPHAAGPPADFEPGVRAALHEFGYILHPEKGWRVHRSRDEPVITGVILTRQGHIRLPDALKRLMRKLSRSVDPHDAVRLEGYQGYEAMVTQRPGELRGRKR
jgi:hypothetical protein